MSQQLYQITVRIHALLKELGLPKVESDYWITPDGQLWQGSEVEPWFQDGEPQNGEKQAITESALRKILADAFGEVENPEMNSLVEEEVDSSYISGAKDYMPVNLYGYLANAFFVPIGSKETCLWDRNQKTCLEWVAEELEKLKSK